MSGLAPWAADARRSRGRRYPEPAAPYRGEFQRDRDRIVHSTSFRRLVYKTQVFVNHEGDLYRTRLTHSLEVSQIARTAALALGLSEPLTEAICLAHDLGHTPFGHAGQDTLEAKYAEFPGLNLMFETREGILKHCSKRNARELGEVGQRFLDRTLPGLEAQLADIADSIAYNNHDVDDGYRAGLLTLEQLREQPLFERHYVDVVNRHAGLEDRRLIYEIIRRMINTVVTDLIDTTRQNIEAAAPATIDDVRNADRRLVSFSPAIEAEHTGLKKFLHDYLYSHEQKLEMTRQAQPRPMSQAGHGLSPITSPG